MDLKEYGLSPTHWSEQLDALFVLLLDPCEQRGRGLKRHYRALRWRCDQSHGASRCLERQLLL